MVPDDLFQVTELVPHGPCQATLHHFTEALLLHIRLGDGLLEELDCNAVGASRGSPVDGIGLQIIVPHKFDRILLFALGKILEDFFLVHLFVRQSIAVKNLIASGNLVISGIFGVLERIMRICIDDQVRPLGAREKSPLSNRSLR